MPGARIQAEGVCSVSCQGWDLGNQVCWPWPSAVAGEVGALVAEVRGAAARAVAADRCGALRHGSGAGGAHGQVLGTAKEEMRKTHLLY